MPQIVNIAAYKFAALERLPDLRHGLRQLCQQQHLRGTILLSTEGINLFVAGQRDDVDALLQYLHQVPGLEHLPVKESPSDDQPFNRMLVKIKREIIAFGVPDIDPGRYTSKRISALQLKQWLDEGRRLTLLDTRNNFEIQAGTFAGAVPIGIDDFRQFPTAVKQLPDAWKQQPVITFCTGGIRCEKAAPYLESQGFQDVYQLDGGILKYLEQCGDAHYRGQCFVFDKRVAVDASLSEGGLRQCFVCQAILDIDQQRSPQYVEGQSCPSCYRTEQQRRQELLAERNTALRYSASPLPGSVAYDNVRPISVPLRFDGWELLDFLDAMRTHLRRDQWQDICAQERLVCRNSPVRPGRIMRAGDLLLHLLPATIEPDVSAAIEVLHEDESLVIVNKPAPLPMHPCGRYNRNTLSYILGSVYKPLHLRPAHRLDADTTGVVVLSKSREIAGRVQPQFERGQVKKRYLARVHGRPTQVDFECLGRLSDEPGPGGVRLPDETGSAASTRFRLMETYADGTSLLQVQPLSGRTNQIRIHLWQLDLPIVGDPIYRRNGQIGAAQTLAIGDPPLCLHAWSIELQHPILPQRMMFTAPPPAWKSVERTD